MEHKIERDAQKFLTESAEAQRIRYLTSFLIKSIICWDPKAELRNVAKLRAVQIQYKMVTISKFKRGEEGEGSSERGKKTEGIDTTKVELSRRDRRVKK